jgi:hypothetical protein
MPRRPEQKKHKGIFERMKGSGIWWIRYTNEQGKRVASKVGTYSAAVKIYDQRTTEIRLGILLPHSPRRGTKFSELVTDAIKFSEKHHRASKDFKQRVEGRGTGVDRGYTEPLQVLPQHGLPRGHARRQGIRQPGQTDPAR